MTRVFVLYYNVVAKRLFVHPSPPFFSVLFMARGAAEPRGRESHVCRARVQALAHEATRRESRALRGALGLVRGAAPVQFGYALALVLAGDFLVHVGEHSDRLAVRVVCQGPMPCCHVGYTNPASPPLRLCPR